MTDLEERKPGGKSGKNKKKHSKKAEQKKPKPDQALTTAPAEPIDDTAPSDNIAETETALALALVEAEPTAVADAPTAVETPVVAAVVKPVEETAKPAKKMELVRAAPVEPAAPPAPPVKPIPAAAVAPATGLQAIANVYRDYTRKALEDAQSFAEKLSAARSLDKAMEAQAEYAKKACENFTADSRKIRELHRELFWQAFRLPNWPAGKSR